MLITSQHGHGEGGYLSEYSCRSLILIIIYIILFFVSVIVWNIYSFIAWMRYLTDGRVNLEVTLSCQFTMFSSAVTSHSSVWILTAMTIEKTFNVLFPLKAKHFCTVKSAKIACASILIFWVLVNSQMFFVYKKHEDGGNSYCYFVYPHFSVIQDLVVYSFLPSGVIIISNVTIITQLISAKYGSNNQSSNTLSKIATSTSVMLVTV